MPVLTPFPRLLALALTFAVLLGCALQPQILPVTPQMDLAGAAARGAGRTIAISVVDGRGNNVVGYRDPADTNSVITTAPELTRVVQREVEQAYTRLGFSVVPQGETADIALTVKIAELGYTRQAGRVVNNINTGATIEATSEMNGKSVTGTYKDAQGKEMVWKPNLADNAEVMNRHLGAALSRMAADPRLTE